MVFQQGFHVWELFLSLSQILLSSSILQMLLLQAADQNA
jgi:hypothetical protein